MSAISLKSITGITSITTPAGVDNQLTLHNNNTSEAVKLDTAGNLHFHNHLNITGVSTAANFKTGTSNLHNTGLNIFDLDVDGHTNLDNVSIAGVTTTSDNIFIQADNKYLSIGAHSGGDLLAYHDGTKSVLVNYTGDFHIRSNNGSRSSVEGIILKPSGAVQLYHNGTKKFDTSTAGISVTGEVSTTGHIRIPDNMSLIAGNGSDLFIYHDGNNSFINDTGTGALILDGSKIRLRLSGGTQFETDTNGIIASGTAHRFTSGTSGDCELIIEADTDNNNELDNPRILFRQDGGNDWSAIGHNDNTLEISNSVGSGGIVFKTGTTNGYTNATERLRITSGGQVGINEASNINGRLHVQHDALGENILYATRYNDQTNDKPILAVTEANMSGMTGGSGLVIGNHNRDIHIGPVFGSSAQVVTASTSGLRIAHNGLMGLGVSPTSHNNTTAFQIYDDYNSQGYPRIRLTNQSTGTTSADGYEISLDGSNLHALHRQRENADIYFMTNNVERLRINSSGTIQCGTSGVLKAEINNSVNGHYFVSQCSDNNDGFEIYQQHGSTASRNTLAVYDNRRGSKIESLLIRGDGVKVTRSRGGNYATTYEFNYNDGAPGAQQTVSLATISTYNDVTSAVAEVTYVGVYGTANNYISSSKWICAVRRGNNNSVWNSTNTETAAGGNTNTSSLDIYWSNGQLYAQTVGPWMGWTVNVRLTILNGDITVNV